MDIHGKCGMIFEQTDYRGGQLNVSSIVFWKVCDVCS